mmetsp:Transcript_24447/g.54039  ORF Transcript_24447/g.54039 Transcript_24447/m.54039 type:complete len:213 (+) Transcript_24447:777-1415(+)
MRKAINIIGRGTENVEGNGAVADGILVIENIPCVLEAWFAFKVPVLILFIGTNKISKRVHISIHPIIGQRPPEHARPHEVIKRHGLEALIDTDLTLTRVGLGEHGAIHPRILNRIQLHHGILCRRRGFILKHISDFESFSITDRCHPHHDGAFLLGSKCCGSCGGPSRIDGFVIIVATRNGSLGTPNGADHFHATTVIKGQDTLRHARITLQ